MQNMKKKSIVMASLVKILVGPLKHHLARVATEPSPAGQITVVPIGTTQRIDFWDYDLKVE